MSSIMVVSKSDCCGCETCAQVCPKSCISIKEDMEGFCYPSVDSTQCIECGLCQQSCPVQVQQNIQCKAPKKMPDAYAAYHNDEKIHMDSSSGGVFTALAETVLKNNGVVIGAALDDNLEVKHICITHSKQLKLLRGSKYIQSRINTIYIDAKKYLQSGRKVLFTGTPCQIEGLLCYLQKPYENLYCIDVVCHGVPSAKTWKGYIDFQEKTKKARIQSIYFRKKKRGWSNYNIEIHFSDGKKVEINHRKDAFMQMFLSDVCLRPSCYHCFCRSWERKSDITLADFWGIRRVDKEMYNEKGVSLVMLHSSKGENLFKQAQQDLIVKKVDPIQAVKYNPSMIMSTPIPEKRKTYFDCIDQISFRNAVKQFATIKWHQRFIISAKRIIRKFI